MIDPEKYRENQKKSAEYNRKMAKTRKWQSAIIIGSIAGVAGVAALLASRQHEQSIDDNNFTPVSPATSTLFETMPSTTTEIPTTTPTTTAETTTTTPAQDVDRQLGTTMIKTYVDCNPYYTTSGPNTLARFTPGLQADANIKNLRDSNADNPDFTLHPGTYTLQGTDVNGNTITLPQGGSYSPDSPIAAVHLPAGATAPKSYKIVVNETVDVHHANTSPYTLQGTMTCNEGIQRDDSGTWRPNGLNVEDPATWTISQG